MVSMTTAQRDLLQLLLTTERPIGAAALGAQLHLTPRQVHYGLRDVKTWLGRRHATLRHLPGVGIQVICPPDQRQRMLADLAGQSRFQLILTTEQRQQLLALTLLAATEPLTLQQLQNDFAIARTTVLKELDSIEPWLQTFDLPIARRQHRGCWIAGAERAKRQALAALLWGDLPFAPPITAVRPGGGLVFALAHDAGLLPIVAHVSSLTGQWNLAAGHELVALAESELGARFADEAVAPLALAVAIQIQRAHAGQSVTWDAEALDWIQSQIAWPVAVRVTSRLWPNTADGVRRAEAAMFALQLLCAARDEPWHADHSAGPGFPVLVDRMLAQIAARLTVPAIAGDALLRDGIEALVTPACLRARFGLWAPPKPPTDAHTERYAAERATALQLADAIALATGMMLPADAIDDLTLLLRAAVVRARPERARRVLVVCPSGMATTQLLVARLRARFPRLGTFEVLPMRELTAERIADADLIITTAPLTFSGTLPIDIIQVHPMLRPEDIAALTEWMA